MQNTIQNTIATSKFTLPLCTLYALAVCLAFGMVTHGEIIQLGCLGATVAIMAMINSTYSLTRIYSRTISSSYLMLILTALTIVIDRDAMALSVSFSLFLLIYFNCYQEHRAPGTLFYSSLILGLGSLLFIQVLYLLPLFWLIMINNLMSRSFRNIIASLLGAVLPYWFWLGWTTLHGDTTTVTTHLSSLIEFERIDISLLNNHLLPVLAFITFVTLICMVHYVRTMHQEKIKTRMIYNAFCIITITLYAMLFLQPQHESKLLAFIFISIAPIVGHTVTFSTGRWANRFLCLLLLVTIGMTLYNFF